MVRKIFWIVWKVSGFFVGNTINASFLLQKLFEHTCFVAKTIYTHFFVTKTIYALFCHKKNLRTLFFCRENDFRAVFVAKTIYALRPESFCALKVAIRKVQTFWASAAAPHWLEVAVMTGTTAARLCTNNSAAAVLR